ncbi:hypothetical protein [Antrihabitans stalactiti]|uniref:Uncharacterized protein n=1 Tax=Antrihabitans stalactiti TaxID=2584121 RepID=A0A848KNT9_9NOCA|nr:hypothetical protein [Antrihabitans stalactiti]NMN98312.1 hypothetical protein [Antrihabitans stalactiti]
MNRRILAAAFAFLVTLLMAACSGSDSSSAASSTTQSTATKTTAPAATETTDEFGNPVPAGDLCRFLTEADFQSLASSFDGGLTGLTDGKPWNIGGHPGCDYSLATIAFGVEASSAYELIAGLGSEAHYRADTGELLVRKDNYWFDMNCHACKHDQTKATLVQLATTVVGHVQSNSSPSPATTTPSNAGTTTTAPAADSSLYIDGQSFGTGAATCAQTTSTVTLTGTTHGNVDVLTVYRQDGGVTITVTAGEYTVIHIDPAATTTNDDGIADVRKDATRTSISGAGREPGRTGRTGIPFELVIACPASR